MIERFMSRRTSQRIDACISSRGTKAAARLAFLSILLAVMMPAVTAAQEIRALKITSYDGYLGFGYEYQRDVWQKENRLQNVFSKAHRFIEEPSLEATSYVYHPNFLKLKTSFTWTKKQEFLRLSPAQDYGTNLGIKDYNLEAEFLRRLPVNFRFFASRITTTVDNTYWSRRDLITRRYGAMMQVESQVLPLALQATETEQEGYGFYYYLERRKNLRLDVSNENRLAKTILRGEASDIWRSERNVKSRIEQAEFQNTINPSARARVQLLSNVQYYSQKDGYNTRNIGIQENLNANMMKNLSAQLAYSNSSGTSGDLSNKTETYQAILTHKLYESLLSSLEIFNTSFGFDRGRQVDKGGELRFNYQKSTFFGRIEGGYSARYLEEWQNFLEDVASVIKENHQFTPGVPLFLDRQFIKPETIEIWDDRGVVLYEEGIDYIVRAFNSYTEIIRLPGGNIPENASVLVSYDFDVDPSLSYKTITDQWNVGVNVKNHVTVTYRRKISDQSLLSGVAGDYLQDIDHSVLTLQGMISGTTSTFEYQDYRADINPYISRRMNEYMYFNFSSSSQINFQADYTSIDFIGTPVKATLWDVVFGFKKRLSRSLRTNLRSYYRDHKGQGDASLLYGLENEFKFDYGQIEFICSAAYEHGRIEGLEKRSRFYLKTQLRRYF
jgi:hypothetical protein